MLAVHAALQENAIITFLKRSYILCFLAACTVGIAAVNHEAVVKQFDDWKLLPRPERLTELYFAGDGKLPAATKKDTQQKLSFTIHNNEHRTTTYHYTVVAIKDDDKSRHLLGRNTVLLTHDQSQTINEYVIVPAADVHVAVKVELEYEAIVFGESMPSTQKQSIQYWVKVARS